MKIVCLEFIGLGMLFSMLELCRSGIPEILDRVSGEGRNSRGGGILKFIRLNNSEEKGNIEAM